MIRLQPHLRMKYELEQGAELLLTLLVRIRRFCLRSFLRSKGPNTASSSSALMASSLSSLLQLYSLMNTLSPLSPLPVDDVRPLSWMGLGDGCSPDAATH